MSTHALLAPSSAARWLVCPGSVYFCKNIPDIESEFASEGTAAHHLAETCLKEKVPARKFVGSNINASGIDFIVTKEFADLVQIYVDYVAISTEGNRALYEQRLPLEPLTGEDNAFGTADAVIFNGEELVVIDLKFGRGVQVFAKENEQMMMYAAAAREEYSSLGDFTKFKVVIVQPKLDHIDDWTFDVSVLDEFLTEVKLVAPIALAGGGELVPSEEGCRFCKGKATCPALTEQVLAAASDSFDNLTELEESDISASMAAVDMVEGWCRAVRAEVDRRLLNGMKVAGWKLVEGRKGARSWVDEDEVEKALKAMRLKQDEMYDFKLISPTKAEKLFKDNPRRWNTIAGLISQSQGKPSVAPSIDPRPEIGSAKDAFEELA